MGSDPAREKSVENLPKASRDRKGGPKGCNAQLRLANREAEGRKDGGDGGQSDVYDDAPLVFILVGHYCDSS